MKKMHLLLAGLVLVSTSAFVYVGPGVGLGVIATIVAITLGLLLLAFGFLWYPLKRMLRRWREKETRGSAEDAPESHNQ